MKATHSLKFIISCPCKLTDYNIPGWGCCKKFMSNLADFFSEVNIKIILTLVQQIGISHILITCCFQKQEYNQALRDKKVKMASSKYIRQTPVLYFCKENLESKIPKNLHWLKRAYQKNGNVPLVLLGSLTASYALGRLTMLRQDSSFQESQELLFLHCHWEGLPHLAPLHLLNTNKSALLTGTHREGHQS